MIEWFARNPVAANLLMISIALLGAFSMFVRTPLEIFPSIELDRITIRTEFPGATPAEVEESVTIPIEQAIADVEGIEQMRSRSRSTTSLVDLTIEGGHDLRKVQDDVRARVDAITVFPADVERPSVLQVTRKREVISVVVSGDVSELELHSLVKRVKDDLLSLPLVSQVEVEGTREREIAIEVSENTLREFGLTMQEVADAVRAGSQSVSAGTLRTRANELSLRTLGQAYTPKNFEDISVLARPDGSQLLLGDIATVRDGFDEKPLLTELNGQRAVFIDVYRVGQQSAIEVAKAVRDYVDSANWLPSGVSINYWRDRSKIVKARLNTLLTNALQGGFLVVLMLTLFLRPAVAFWVSLGIPVSFLGCFLVLPFLGVTMNLVSLFAFIVVLGLVVDDAIVTGENVYTHLRRGDPPLQAAIVGTREVAIPVTFGILTTMVAFIPLSIVDGVRGALWAQIPAVVIPVLLFSLIESKLILPAHLQTVKPRNASDKDGWLTRIQQSIADGLEQFVERIYQPVLAVCIRFRYATVGGFIGVLLICLGLIQSGWVGWVFFPRVQSETARASLAMPEGTPFEVTDRHLQRMMAAAVELREQYRDNATGESVIRDILSSSGWGGAHRARVVFEVVAPEQRETTVSSSQLVREWRQLIGPIPGAETLTFRAEIGRGGDPVDIQFISRDAELLETLGEHTSRQLENYPDLFDIQDSHSRGNEEIELRIKPQAGTLGVRLSDLASQVRQSFFGFEIQRLQRDNDEIKVVLRYPQTERRSVEDLQNMLIRTADGSQVPFSEVATIHRNRGPAVLYRINQQRTLNVVADANKESADIEAIKRDLTVFLNQLTAPHSHVSWSFEGEAKEQRETLSTVFTGVVAVTFVIYVLLAIPFKSYLQPLVVMTIIPFGLIGAVGGHIVMGMALSITSMLGLLALTGVVVNDSLVLVDHMNKQRRKGVELMDAVRTSGVARFRAIILTSATTFAGLMPLLFDKSTQAQFLIPMAVSLGFGILFATLITLVLVPATYLIAEDIKRSFYAIYLPHKKIT